MSYTLKNTGNATLTVFELSDDSDQFSFSPTMPPSIDINAGDSLRVIVIFSPTSIGLKSGTLKITHSAGGSLFVTITGVGQNPQLPSEERLEIIGLPGFSQSWSIMPIFSRKGSDVYASSSDSKDVGHENFDQTWGPLRTPTNLKLKIAHYGLFVTVQVG